MRETYTTLKKAHFRNIGKYNQFTDTALLEDFQYSLGQRYQMILGSLQSYINTDETTDVTVAGTQYYSYKPGIVNLDAVKITVGSFSYPLTTIYDQGMWNWFNSIPFQGSAIPQFIFPRQDDYGIWPIPQAVYTITVDAFQRDRNLLVDDYSDGTVALTATSATVTGTSTTFTPAMVGRWFTITDTSVPGQGYWYRVSAYTSPTVITLNMPWNAANLTGKTYRIGESPEIPEECHAMLPMGTASDYYAGMRNDADNATRFDNAFWTGSYNNSQRDIGNDNIQAGLIGLINKYQNRDRSVLVQRQPVQFSPNSKLFATVLS